MADLIRLRRGRVAAKGWLSRAVGKAEEVVEKKTADICVVRNAIQEFDRRLTSWDDAQSAVELELETSELEADIEEAGQFRDGVVDVRVGLEKLLCSIQSQSVDQANSVGSASACLKLPKLDLPKFSGDPMEWPTFWESFEACVADSDLPDVAKLTYLRSLLRGVASQCVAGMSLTAENYHATVDILKNRFGRQEQIVFAHVQALLMLGTTSFKSLQELQDVLLVHIRSLEVLDIGGSKYGVILTPLILSKLPEEVRLEWARQGAGKESDLEFLMQFLSREIHQREVSSAYGGLTHAGGAAGAGSEGRHAAEGPAAGSCSGGVAARSFQQCSGEQQEWPPPWPGPGAPSAQEQEGPSLWPGPGAPSAQEQERPSPWPGPGAPSAQEQERPSPWPGPSAVAHCQDRQQER